MATRIEFTPDVWEMYGPWIGAEAIPIQRIDTAPNGNKIFYATQGNRTKIVIRSIPEIVQNSFVEKPISEIPNPVTNNEAGSWSNVPKQNNDWVYKVRPIAAAFSMVGPAITNAPLQVQRVVSMDFFFNQVIFMAQDGNDIKTILLNGDGTIRDTSKILNFRLSSLPVNDKDFLGVRDGPTAVPINFSSNGEPQIKLVKSDATLNPSLVTGATITNLTTLIQDQRKSIEDMMEVARRLSPVVTDLKASEAAYEQAFEADTPPPVPGVGSSLQGFALIFLLASYLALALILSLYAWTFTGSLKNVALVLGTSLGIGLLIVGLIQRFG